jgi:N-(2-amino-2-carboxyethyl)-L-glutamate synthase
MQNNSSQRWMLDIIAELGCMVGNTPLKKLRIPGCNVYAKLEYTNLTGSVKDRPAIWIMEQAIRSGKVREGTTVIESSSGNFAIALAMICKGLGIDFMPVIDPNISNEKEEILNVLCKNVVKVDERDKTGGYLLTRIERVKNLCSSIDNSFWPDQYSNEDNYMSYYRGMANELISELPSLGYVFVAVSSGGTITGISKRIKEIKPDVKVFAVDVEGSVIFGQPPAPRHVSGIGASQKSALIEHASIDDIYIVSEAGIIDACLGLLNEHLVFGGASAGACYNSVQRFIQQSDNIIEKDIVFICPDKGDAYLKTIYNEKWKRKLFEKVQQKNTRHL